MTAAITAAQNGKSVIILEKATIVGGNTSYATGGVHGGNRLGGNAVADFTVFGRIAGESASK